MQGNQSVFANIPELVNLSRKDAGLPLAQRSSLLR